MVSATFIVYQDDGEEIEVEVEGRVERFGSYNPSERYGIDDWWVNSPEGFVLSNEDRERAVQALYDNLGW